MMLYMSPAPARSGMPGETCQPGSSPQFGAPIISLLFWLMRIPAAWTFIGHGGHSTVPDRCHVHLGKWGCKSLGGAEGGVLLSGITEPEQRHVGVAGERVMQALRH
jgi:hypothetical protein